MAKLFDGWVADVEKFIEETRSYETDFETDEDRVVAVNLNIAMDALAEIIERYKPNANCEPQGSGKDKMKDKWIQKKYGTGWQCRSFTIEPSHGEWCLKCNGQFVASFKTAGSCKRVGQCILREFSRLDETLHFKPNAEHETRRIAT